MIQTKVTKPKRVLLRGFDDATRLGVADWIRSQGIEVIQLVSLADMVVAGPDALVDMLQKTQTKAARVMSWEEFRAMLSVQGGAGASSIAEGEDARGGEAGVGARIVEAFSNEGMAQVPLERLPEGFRVLDLVVPFRVGEARDAGWVPGWEQFAHVCLDKLFLETLRSVALGVLHGMPVALEGDTAASKTSAVLFLAHCLGQPVVRINLSGHTDAAELVGRYVPTDSAEVIDWGELTPQTPWLSRESRAILEGAREEQRALSAAERLSILGRERFPVNQWRFHEGYLPRAMRNGWWLLLDELNLAETQVLERLNCALENPPGLVLTEGDGTVFGGGGTVAVHADFRMVSTMNPSEYAGRSVLSQAFIDRWGVWHQASVPGEREIEQMLRFLVFGEHPRVVIGGQAYRAQDGVAVYPELQAIPEIGALLQRLAVFHHGIFKAAGGGGGTPSIGRLQKERYSFSRRILLNLMQYVARKIRGGALAEEVLIPEAVQTFYLARVRGEADRRAVNNILRAGGLL